MKTFILLVILLNSSAVHSQDVSAPNVPAGPPLSGLILVPLPTIGPSLSHANLTNGATSNVSLAYSLGLAGAYYPYRESGRVSFAPYGEISFESRAVSFRGADDFLSSLHASYITISPGLQYHGFLTLAVAVSVPIHASYTTLLTQSSVLESSISPSAFNVLIEPKVLLGLPLGYFYGGREILAGFLSLGYPFRPTLKQEFSITDGRGVALSELTSLKYFTVQLGISIAFVINGRFLGWGLM